MIVPMKKVHLIVDEKRVDATLEKLRALGLVHIEHLNELKSHPLSHQYEELGRLERVLAWMELNKKGVAQQQCHDPRKVFHEVDERLEAGERLKESTHKRSARIEQWKPWGHFRLDDLQALEAKGIYVRLYEIPVADLGKLPKSVICEAIFKSGGIARCVVISRERVDLGHDQVSLPPLSLNEEKAIQETEMAKLRQFEADLLDKVKYLNALKEFHKELTDHIRFAEAKVGMQREESISILKGFAPADETARIEKAARQEHWGVLIEDVGDADRVPTCTRNPKWVELIRPVFALINIFPGYRELDMSPVFLVFFTIFVGMLIGDAGYAVICTGLFVFMQLKIGKKMQNKAFFPLMYTLCASTFIWGALTGVYFGQAWIQSAIPPLAPWLTDNINLQALCFLIGAIHLSIAHLWRMVNRWPSPSLLSQAGWFIIIWAMFLTARFLVLNLGSLDLAVKLLAGGSILVVFFTAPNINPLKAIGPGLGDLLLNVINSFTDVISYIRLFAVGLATVAVADAANNMNLFWIIFLHTLNIILAAMAVLVHGLRLNLLEFSGHLGMEWTGIAYNPFKRIKQA
jgi:V/A-type H+-transporting ATPase subunit I